MAGSHASSSITYWPWFAAPLIPAAASVFSLGADTGPSVFVYSTLILLAAALAAATRHLRLGPAAWSAIAAYLAFLLLGAVKGWLASGAAEYAALAGAGALFLIARAGARVFERGAALWSVTLILFACVAAAAFIDHMTSPGAVFGFEKLYHRTRLTAPFLSANTAATFYGVGAACALAGMLKTLRDGGQGGSARTEALARGLLVPALAFVLCLTCLVLTASRAGVIIALASGLALLIWDAASSSAPRGGGRTRWALAALLVFAAGGAILTVSSEQLGARLTDAGRGAGMRLDLLAAYWDAVRFAPVFGHGPGGFEYVNDLSATADTAALITVQNAAHNIVLQWLLQAGLVGAAAAAAIVLAVTRSIATGLARRRRGRTFMRAGLVALALTFAHGLFDYALEIPGFLWMLAWVAGLAAGFGEPTRARARLKPAVSFALAAGCLALAAASAWQGVEHARAGALARLTAGQAADVIAGGPPERASLRRMEAFADLAFATPGGADAARGALEAAVRREPRAGDAWARLAYARMLGGDRGAAAAALAKSYERMPYAGEALLAWRLELAAFIWPGLDPQVKAAAVREARFADPAARARFLTATGACSAEGAPTACLSLSR
ncbi:MAG: O-antigen ligase family protein [Oceanicaulis sp.]